MARKYNGNFIQTLCWKCQYSVPYPENEWRCIWEESKGKTIPDYVDDYRISSNCNTDESALILSCERYERDPRYADRDNSPQPKRKYTKPQEKVKRKTYTMMNSELARKVLEAKGLSMKDIVKQYKKTYCETNYPHTVQQIIGNKSITIVKLHRIEKLLGLPEDSLDMAKENKNGQELS